MAVLHDCSHGILYKERRFHIQTEVSPGEAPRIRTQVFRDGVIIASREISGSDHLREGFSELELHDLTRRLHKEMIQALISDRTRELCAEDALWSTRMFERTKANRRAIPDSDARTVGEGERPSLALAANLEVRRRLVALHRLSLAPVPTDSDTSDQRLQTMVTGIALVNGAELSTVCRLSEVADLHMYQSEALGWLAEEERTVEEAQHLWVGLGRVLVDMSQINSRALLVSHDLSLSRELLDRTRRPEQLAGEQLVVGQRALFGRSHELDSLSKGSDSPRLWRLQAVLARIVLDLETGREVRLATH